MEKPNQKDEFKSRYDQLSKPLNGDEVEFRLALKAKNKDGWITLIPYKTANIDKKRLNEVFGPTNWEREHSGVKGEICTLRIRESKEDAWVSKTDIGTESTFEREKGLFSDGLKRAGFCLGIGAELYDYPKIQIQLTPEEKRDVKKVNSMIDNLTCHVEHNGNKKLTCLRLTDEKFNIRFKYNADGLASMGELMELTILAYKAGGEVEEKVKQELIAHEYKISVEFLYRMINRINQIRQKQKVEKTEQEAEQGGSNVMPFPEK